VVIGAFAAAGVLAWSQLPKGGYPTDLSRIGQGQAAVVLALDPHFVSGTAVMNLLHDVRDEFGHSVQFLVAPLAQPDAQAFAAQHQAADGTVLLFDARGQRVAVLRSPQTRDEVRQAVREAFGL
jgi:hypothetical protein